MTRFIKLFISISLLAALTGCALFRVYQPDQQQGTALSQTDISQLNSSMNRSDIIDAFGSPVVSEPLKPQQMIYPYTKRESGTETHNQVVIIHLDAQDNFQRVETIGELLEE